MHKIALWFQIIYATMILQKLIQKHSNGEVDMILNGIVGMKSQQIEEDLFVHKRISSVIFLSIAFKLVT